MANREMVELFISCLSETMASAVLQHLGRYGPEAKAKDESVGARGKSDSTPKPRRPEDKYDLEDVCRAAIQVSEILKACLTS